MPYNGRVSAKGRKKAPGKGAVQMSSCMNFYRGINAIVNKLDSRLMHLRDLRA